MRIFIFRLKKMIIPTCICIFTVFLIMFSSTNLIAAKNGLILWAMSVVPSLLPFFIATELLSYTSVVSFLGKFLNKFMRPIFNVPGEGSFALIMGIISGYPIGAKIVCNLKEQGICTNEECERLLAFTNNSGPLFIIGTVGISLFSSSSIGIKLFIVHVLSCFLVGFIFRWWKYNKRPSTLVCKRSSHEDILCFNNLGAILSNSIQNSIKLVLTIGGFIVLFSVIVSILNSSKILNGCCMFLNPFLYMLKIPVNYSPSIITGFIEVTNGVNLAAIDSSPLSVIICSFLLGFGGISILLQVLSITSQAKISIKPYILGKILQACLSALLMYFFL